MRMVGVAPPDADPIIVVDHEATEADVRRIVVFAEGEAVVGLCPVGSGEEALPSPPQLNVWCASPRHTHWFSIAAIDPSAATASAYAPHMPVRPVPEPIAPGQESVWDYPRRPAIRASDEEIIVILGGAEICETRTSLRVLETGHPPTYYLPRAAFAQGALRPARGWSYCEWKGQASYLDVIGGSKIPRRAG